MNEIGNISTTEQKSVHTTAITYEIGGSISFYEIGCVTSDFIKANSVNTND